MDWLTGGKRSEVKHLIAQLADSTLRDRAAHELIRLDTDALPHLIEALQTSDVNLLPQLQQILAQMPSSAPALLKLISNAHPSLRARAAEVFAINKDKTAVPALIAALQGEYFSVRSRAALALGKIGNADAVQPLLFALKDKEAEVRIAACLALGAFKDPTTFENLADILLDDPVIEVRQAAAKALGNTSHPNAIPYLMEALRDSFWWYERESAADDLLRAIHKMGNAAVGPLLEALQDKEAEVRKFAARLLGRIGDPRSMEPLAMAQYDMHHEVGNASAEALALFDAPAIPVLIEALSHPESWIRVHAARALGTIDDPQVTSVLLELLDDPQREVRKEVIEALGKRRDRSALKALQNIAHDRKDRELAQLAKKVVENFR
ncbi:MAG: HEAT repeat domain-containing protein [Chloroflexota bacterium]